MIFEIWSQVKCLSILVAFCFLVARSNQRECQHIVSHWKSLTVWLIHLTDILSHATQLQYFQLIKKTNEAISVTRITNCPASCKCRINHSLSVSNTSAKYLYQSISLSVYQSNFLSLYLFISLSLYLFISSSLHLFISSSLCLSIHWLMTANHDFLVSPVQNQNISRDWQDGRYHAWGHQSFSLSFKRQYKYC